MFDLRKDHKKIIPHMMDTTMGLPSGINALDRYLLGFHLGELSIIAGRPGMGKSSIARDIALSIGCTQTVVFFSLEMTCTEVAELLLVNLAKVDYYNIMRGGLTDKIVSHLEKISAQLSTYNIIINDDSYLTPGSIREVLTELSQQDTISCVVVDYIQLMSIGRRENRQAEVSEISRELKGIAKEFDTTVLAMSQLNRQLEYRESTVPRLSDLRESGSLEQDAHKVLLLHRPSYYDVKLDPDAEDTGEAEIIIAKNRKGKVGKVSCAWIGEYMSFQDIPKDF